MKLLPFKPQVQNPQLPMLALDQSRVLLLQDQVESRNYKFVFDPIPADAYACMYDWLIYSGGGRRKFGQCRDDPWTWLVRQYVSTVEGYSEVSRDDPNWREGLPENHVLAVAQLLGDIRTDTDWPFAHVQDVYLAVPWSPDGELMARLEGLVHRLRLPSLEQEQRYLSAFRNATSQSFPARKVMSLYDELIEDVGGYSVAGRRLEGKEEPAELMDGAHKIEAVMCLFTSLYRREVSSGHR